MVKFISENWANILLIIVGSFALATYILQERKKKIDAASLIVLQIDEFQERLREISTFIVDGQLNETAFYESLPLMDTDYWNKYKHYFVRKMDATSYTALNQLYEYVSEIQEQQMLMKAFQKNSFQITQNVLANIESQFIVADLNNALAETMKESQLCIFKAKGSVFVTSDMPVVNIYGEKDGIEYDLLGMPITPELFLAFVDTVQRVPRIIIIDDNSVKRMNSKQINKDLLISNRIDLLSYIDFSIDAEKEDDEQVYQLLHTDKETALKQYEDMMSSKEIKYWR